MKPVESPWLPRLSDLAGSADLAAFWRNADALLQELAPHATAVGWDGMATVVLGADAQLRRERVRDGLRAMIAETGEDAPMLEGIASHAGEAMLGGNALLATLREPMPAHAQALSLEQLQDGGQYFRRILQPQGWRHALLLPLRAGDGIGGAGIVIYRSAEEGGFQPAEVADVEALRPALAQVLARIGEHAQQQATQANVQRFLLDLPVGLMLFDWEWRPLFINEEGYRQTQLWNYLPAIPPQADARIDFRLPPAVREAGDRLRGRWVEEVLGIAPPRSTAGEHVVHALRKDLQASVMITQSKRDLARPPALMVRYSGIATRADSAFQPSPAQLSILSQLTPGERKVALLVMRGMSNREIAEALHRDITTVKDHLGHIYGKLGIRSRTQLAAQLAG